MFSFSVFIIVKALSRKKKCFTEELLFEGETEMEIHSDEIKCFSFINLPITNKIEVSLI